MDSIKKSLADVLVPHIKKFGETADLDEQEKIAKNINILANVHESIVKEENDHEEKMERLKMEQSQYDDSILDRRDEMTLKQVELEEKKKSRIWGTIKEVGVELLKTGVTVGLSFLIIDFEREGTLTSSLRNGVLGRFMKK